MRGSPNFLLFVTDQHRADHLGCYGGRSGVSPAIDALARRGCVLDHMHVATPVCQPNRASLITGRLPSAHGVRMNGRELSLSETSFVDTLRQAGWRTALVGKAHLQNITNVPATWPAASEPRLNEAKREPFQDYGQEVWSRWEEDPTHELKLPYYGFESVALSIGHGDNQHGHWRRWLRQQTQEADRLIGPANAIPTPGLALAALGQAWRTRLPEELHPTRWIANETCTQLQQLASQQQPFFLQCSFPDPHHPFTPPGRYWDWVKPEDVQLPPSFAHGVNDKLPPLAWLQQQRRQQPQFKPGYASFQCSEQEAREAIALNLGNIAFIDDAIARVLQQLAQSGLADNTVVIFTSDHADLMGERGLLFKGGFHYASLTRVPFIWVDPTERNAPERVDHALAQTIDIAPTILERAGLACTNGMQGRSLLPLMSAEGNAAHNDTFSSGQRVLIEEESQRRDFGLSCRLRLRTLRTLRFRCTVWHGQPWGELYDLEQDPLELHNLWNEPSARDLQQHALTELMQAMLAAQDDSPYPSASA